MVWMGKFDLLNSLPRKILYSISIDSKRRIILLLNFFYQEEKWRRMFDNGGYTGNEQIRLLR